MKNGLFLVVVGLLTTLATAQHAPPPSALRSAEIRRDAIVGVTLIVRPGESIENAVILTRDGVIEAVGTELVVPDGYRTRMMVPKGSLRSF